jgi:DNA primase
VDAAVPVVDYYFAVAAKDLDVGSSAKDKAEFVRRLAPVLSDIRDEVERTHYVQMLARLVRVDEATLRRQLRRADGRGSEKRASTTTDAADATDDTDAFAVEEYCLSVLLRRPELLERANRLLADEGLQPLRADDFERTENRSLFAAWHSAPPGQDWHEWAENLAPTLRAHLDAILSHGLDTDELVGAEAERDIERSFLALRHKNVERVSRSLQMLQTESLEQGEPKATEYGQTMIGLATERLRLERALAQRTALGKHERKERVQ